MEAVGRSFNRGLLECIVVDNGSDDDFLGLLRREFAWAHVIPTGKNNGFARGCNIGLERVRTPYTIFINPDAIVEPAAIRTMLDFLELRPRVGIVGPAIIEGDLYESRLLQQTGDRATPSTLLRNALPFSKKRHVTRPIEPGSAGFRTGWVCGAVLMVRTNLAKRLNGFDPRFFLYWEETDLCKRAEDLGYEVWALGKAVTHHVGGASAPREDSTRIGGCIAKHYFQSRFYYMTKHHGWLAAVSAEAGELLLRGGRAVFDLARGRGADWLRSRMQAPLFSRPDRLT